MDLFTLLGVVIIAWTLINAYLIYWKSTIQSDHRLFALFLAFYALFIGSYLLLIEGEFYLDVPWMLRSFAPTVFLAIPLFFLYLRVKLKKTTLTVTDFLHFVPAFIVFSSYLPVYVLDNQEKFRIIDQILSQPDFSHNYGTGLFPPYVMAIIKLLFFGFYLIVTIRLMLSYKEYFYLNSSRFSWLQVTTYFFVGISLSYMIFTSNQLGEIFELWESRLLRGFAYSFTYLLVIGINFYIGFYLEEIFADQTESDEGKKQLKNNIQPSFSFTPNDLLQETLVSPVGDGLVMEAVEVSEDFKSIDSYIRTYQIYQQKNFTLAQLSNHLNITERKLSTIIHQNTNKGFKDFINSYRAEFAKSRIEEGYLKNYTVEALAELSGFNSRVTFFHSFKKLVGTCPRDYWKAHSSIEK